MLFKELWLSLWLATKYRWQGYRGAGYPLMFTGHPKINFHHHRDLVETTFHNHLRYHPLAKFLAKERRDLVVVCITDGVVLRTNIYELPHDGGERDIYNECRGDDGTFTYVLTSGVLRRVVCKGQGFYTPTAPILSWKGSLPKGTQDFLMSLNGSQ